MARPFGKSTAIVAPLVAALVSGAAAALAAAPPTFVSATQAGGASDQRASGAAVAGTEMFVAGWDFAVWVDGLSLNYDVPAMTPDWSASRANTHYYAVATAGDVVFEAGLAWPGTCGAYDGAGGTEWKVGMSVRSAATGADLGCSSWNFFAYYGGESYWAVAAQLEGGVPFAYAGGSAEKMGWGNSAPIVLAKYNAAGVMLNAVTEPEITWGSFDLCMFVWPYCGASGIRALTTLGGGDVVAAGYSGWWLSGEDATRRPALSRYTPTLARAWKVRPLDNPGGSFYGVAVIDGAIYAVGATSPSGFIAEKYNSGWGRDWTAQWGGLSDSDALYGVAGLNGRVFAAGSTRAADGSLEMVLFELDPANGDRLSTTTWGGAQDDVADGLVTDGTFLYMVGETRSFPTLEGNVVPSGDAVIVKYSLAPPLTLDELDVSAAEVYCGTAQTFTAVASGGEGTLKYAWDIDGDLDYDDGLEVNPLTAVLLPPGPHTIGVRVTDSGASPQSVEGTIDVVVDPLPPPTISGMATVVCGSGPVTLTAGAGYASYLWSTGATTQAITVTPSVTTTYSVTVTNAYDCTASASHTVTVTCPEIGISPVPVEFGNVVIGATSCQAVTVSNTGTAPLSVGVVPAGIGPFTLSGNGCAYNPVAPGGSCTFTVCFKPTAASYYQGLVTVHSNDPDEAATPVALKGSGVVAAGVPDIRTNVSVLNFAGRVGVPQTKTVTITNAGTATLHITGFTVAGTGFQPIPPLSVNLAPGDVLNLTITFVAPRMGMFTGTLTIASDDPDTPSKIVYLRGSAM